MELVCDLKAAAGYKSPAQIARVVSETWASRNAYCLVCEEDFLGRSPANTKSTDFSCFSCRQNYELKAFLKRPRKSLIDGAYTSLIGRIMNGSAPTLLLMERTSSWAVHSLTAIHSVFLTPSVVEMRKPLGPSAVRSGWIGCNIRLDRIGPDGEIKIIEHGRVLDRESVRRHFRRFNQLSAITPTERGWTTLTLSMIRALSKKRFVLSDLYEEERNFQACYPRNKNIRAKIRQQLQVLRDLGLIEFEARGSYALLG